MSGAGAGARCTVGDVVRRGLAALGVEAVYGAPFAGVPVAEVGDAGVAALLAEAHLLVHRAPCALHTGGGAFTVLARSSALAPPPAGHGDAERRAGSGGATATPPGAELGTARSGTAAAAAPAWAGPGAAPSGPAAGAGAAPSEGLADGPVGPVVADDLGALAGCWPAVAERLARPGGLALLAVGLDPAAPGPDGRLARPAPADRWVDPDAGAIARIDAARDPMLLVGPGVAEPALVPGLHALAAAGGFGVLNTWGAKGVFDWRSQHHWATVGLQARDLELGGVGEADLVIAAGLDGREVPARGWDPAKVVTLEPGALGPAAQALGRTRGRPGLPPLRDELARVTQEGWAHDDGPLPPSRVTRTYAQQLGSGGLVAADPGVAGYWVARTFATTALGGAVVPARPDAAGLAAACVAVARRRSPDRPALAVVTAGAAGLHDAVVEVAAGWGVRVPVERWAPDGPALDAAAHADRLAGLVEGDGANGQGEAAADLATSPDQLARMIDAAGEVVAWTPA